MDDSQKLSVPTNIQLTADDLVYKMQPISLRELYNPARRTDITAIIDEAKTVLQASKASRKGIVERLKAEGRQTDIKPAMDALNQKEAPVKEALEILSEAINKLNERDTVLNWMCEAAQKYNPELEGFEALYEQMPSNIQNNIINAIKGAQGKEMRGEDAAALTAMLGAQMEMERIVDFSARDDVYISSERDVLDVPNPERLTYKKRGKSGELVDEIIKIDNDVGTTNADGKPISYDTKSYPRKPWGGISGSENQLLKYDAAVEQGLLAGAYYEINGRIDQGFVENLALNDDQAPNVGIIYTLQLPSGARYSFPLKTPQSGEMILPTNLADQYTGRDQVIVSSIEALLESANVSQLITALANDIPEELPEALQGVEPETITDLKTYRLFHETRLHTVWSNIKQLSREQETGLDEELVDFLGEAENDPYIEKLIKSGVIETDLDRRIGDDGFEGLASTFKDGRTPRYLNLSDHHLSDESVPPLCDVLRNSTTLTELDLSNNFITEEGLSQIALALKENVSLVSLYLDGNGFNHSGNAVAEMTQALGDHPNLIDYTGPTDEMNPGGTELIKYNELEIMCNRMIEHPEQMTRDDWETINVSLPAIVHLLAEDKGYNDDEIRALFEKVAPKAWEYRIELDSARMPLGVDVQSILSISKLFEPAQGRQHSPFYQAISEGKYEDVKSFCQHHDYRLTANDYAVREGEESSPSVIEMLSSQGKLSDVFTLENWKSEPREMSKVWDRVPPKEKRQLDGREGRPSYDDILKQVNRSASSLKAVSDRNVGE